MALNNFFESPVSFRLRQFASDTLLKRDLGDTQFIMAGGNFTDVARNLTLAVGSNTTITSIASAATAIVLNHGHKLPPHSSHPDFLHLAGLVSEAVLEVVFVALPGFLVAYAGMFTAENQKFMAELNTTLFTPCLIFTKLASQLTADKLADLAIIPLIFIVQIAVSYLCSIVMARVWGFAKKPMQRNFILAMGVFGNSNSLPISLVISLSKTISGLHWDKLPGDNDNEVAARGILYLLIFQQLGQLLRWTWGYSVLLKPASEYEDDERPSTAGSDREVEEGLRKQIDNSLNKRKTADSGFGSDSHSPETSSISSASSSGYSEDSDERDPLLVGATPANGNNISEEPRNRAKLGGTGERSQSVNHINFFPNFSRSPTTYTEETTTDWKSTLHSLQAKLLDLCHSLMSRIESISNNIYATLPPFLQKTVSKLRFYNAVFWAGVWRQMNPPLWAMLAALVVASVPALQRLFFTPGSFVNNSITSAIKQSGGVAVPLILVVLGANLARSTLPQDQLATTPEAKAEERKLLYAALLSRMVLPTIIMAPILALVARYAPISILADPIFIIVCFLLTGAPSALQLAQICQMNGVFMGAMSNLLVLSYVVAIFPSTLTLVMLALETVEWSTAAM